MVKSKHQVMFTMVKSKHQVMFTMVKSIPGYVYHGED
jgi:hypothetical protein